MTTPRKEDWKERMEDEFCVMFERADRESANSSSEWAALMEKFIEQVEKESEERTVRDIYQIAGKVIYTNLQIENDGITIFARIQEYAKEKGIDVTS